MSTGAARALVATGGLVGLAGVTLSAAAAHVTGPGSLDIAARFLLVHAPVFLALAALLRSGGAPVRLLSLCGAAMAFGLVLFCGDLAWRSLVGVPPVPMVAPTGGILLMLAWLALALSALAWTR